MNITLFLICLVAISTPIMLFIFDQFHLRKWHLFVLLFMIVISLLLESRTGIVAILASTLIYYFSYIKKRGKKVIVLTLFFFFTILIALLFYRPDSVYGRLLIYQVLLTAIFKKPLFGYGWDAMYRCYMFHQASFFSNHSQHTFIMYADNNYYPFNEFLGIAYRYGLVAMFFIIVFVFVLLYKCKGVIKSTIVSLLVIVNFSYPFSYNPNKKEIEKIYETAVRLSEFGKYSESDELLMKCSKYFNNYDTELLKGNNKLQTGCYNEAIDYFTTAHNMIPSRFYPLYGLLLCYEAQKNNEMAKKIAESILLKEIKIPSQDIEMIKEEASNYLLQF